MRSYATPLQFRTALEDRVRAVAKQQVRPMNRVRALAVMERFLARALTVLPDSCLLKGGLALELRLDRARTTKDIDLRMSGDPVAVQRLLETAAALVPTPDDHLRFLVTPDPEHPKIVGDGAVYEGVRFVVRTTIASQPYGDPFGVDVAFGDEVHGDPLEVEGSDLFAFIGVPAVRARVYPACSHIAEKLHAYTLPWPDGRSNSRVKDLPDIALLAASGTHDAAELLTAIRKTFDFRKSHALPPGVPDPPSDWEQRYRRLADDEGLRWREVSELHAAVRAFLAPVLAGEGGTWDPASWSWR